MLSYLYTNALREYLFQEHLSHADISIKYNAIQFVKRYQEALDWFYAGAFDYLVDKHTQTGELDYHLLHILLDFRYELDNSLLDDLSDPFGYIREQIVEFAKVLEPSDREVITLYLSEFDSNVLYMAKTIYNEYMAIIYIGRALYVAKVFMLSAILGLDNPIFYIFLYLFRTDVSLIYSYQQIIYLTYDRNTFFEYHKVYSGNVFSYYNQKYDQLCNRHGFKLFVVHLVNLCEELLGLILLLGFGVCALKYLLTSELLSSQVINWLLEDNVFLQGMCSSNDHPFVYIWGSLF